MINLNNLVSPWLNVDDNIFITGIATDSRKVQPGNLFLSLQAKNISQAIEKGARAVICAEKSTLIPCYYLPDLPKYIGPILSKFYNYPSKDLNVIGITGTNGKTTVAYLLTQAYAQLNIKSYYLGTLGAGPIENIIATGMTTPPPQELQQLCLAAKNQGYHQLTMEVSSHALDQYRVDGIDFKQAIFTNLTHDHLDYHGTIAAYAAAKARLFTMPTLQEIIINADDQWAPMMTNPNCQIYRVGFGNNADVRVLNNSWSIEGMHLTISSPWGTCELTSRLLGDFNIYNILTVFTALMARGFKLDTIIPLIAGLKAPPGRMEIIAMQPLVLVDYAHTPDALEKALQTLHDFKLKTQAHKLWVVFGCGGCRDTTKRQAMGAIASRLADKVIVTSDNPRTEDPHHIMAQILSGVTNNATSIVDRKQAIHKCLSQANSNDIILIAGKGHENYQIIGTEKTHFSDQEVVRSFIQ